MHLETCPFPLLLWQLGAMVVLVMVLVAVENKI